MPISQARRLYLRWHLRAGPHWVVIPRERQDEAEMSLKATALCGQCKGRLDPGA